ncbi:MAG: hypothetical protein [Anelloviridae sp.]|nr:MAG: hypothetical protein [Anelloviridae sp.]
MSFGAVTSSGSQSEGGPSKTGSRHTPYTKSTPRRPVREPAKPALKKVTSTPTGSSQSPALEELLELITRVEESCWQSSARSSGGSSKRGGLSLSPGERNKPDTLVSETSYEPDSSESGIEPLNDSWSSIESIGEEESSPPKGTPPPLYSDSEEELNEGEVRELLQMMKKFA